MKRSDIGPFAIVPEWIIMATHGTIEFRVWYELARRANSDGQAWPSYANIAERIGASERSVKRAVANLKDLGAIEIEARTMSHGGSTSNLYTVMFCHPDRRERVTAGTPQGGDNQDTPGGDIGVLSLNKDEREPTLTLTNSLTPKSPLSDSDTPDPRTPGSARDLPFTDREQSASDARLIETGSPNQAPPPLEGKALRAADAIGLPDPEWATEWHEWLQDRKDRRLPNTPRALNKQLELLRSDSDPKGVLEAAMRCAWKGLFPSKPAKRGKPRLADEINRYLAQ